MASAGGAGRGRNLTLPAWLGSEGTTTHTGNMAQENNHVDNGIHSPSTIGVLSSVIPGQYADNVATQGMPTHVSSTDSQYYPQGAYPAQYYTPFNQSTPSQNSNPLSQVTIAITPPQLIRPSHTVMVGVPIPSQVSVPPTTAQIPYAAAASVPQQQTPSFHDANNDVSSWTEHVGDDGRTYWHNRVTKTSTYDKPECLKCPEERSIPPCRWKEYSTDGKIYYSDGKESSWTMPEEFREWKERVEAAVARRKAALQQPPSQSTSSTPISSAAPAKTVNNEVNAKPSENNNKKTNSQPSRSESTNEPAVTYPNAEAALEAFRALLDEFHVTSTMKFKEVQDLCSQDPRWNACKTTGERKQNLAEYQTKKMKQEKEAKKVLARRARDNFFLLLAECSAIDSATRWREAAPLLENDKRFKEVESAYDREDYFNEFVAELKKRERAEKEDLKKEIVHEFQSLLQSLVEKGQVTHLTVWNEIRSDMIEVFNRGRLNQLEEFEKKRIFLDYLHELQNIRREEERRARQERIDLFQRLKGAYHQDIEKVLAKSFPNSHDEPRWRDIAPLLELSQSFVEIVDFNESDKTKALPGFKIFTPRDIFEEFMAHRREEIRFHKRIFFDILTNYNLEITHESRSEEIIERFDDIYRKNQEKASTVPYQLTPKEMNVLNDLLTIKKTLLVYIINDVVERRKEEWEEKERHRRKLEDRYLDLLDELFNRSDQISLSWEDAKKELAGYSAFEALGKHERKRFFYEHMRELKQKLEVKLIKTNELMQQEEMKLQEVMREREEAEREQRRLKERQEANEREDKGNRDREEEERRSRTSSFSDSHRENGHNDGSSHRKRHSDHDEKREDHRKKSRHDDSESDDNESRRSSKSHKKEKKQKDKDREKDDREKDRRKHKKHKKESREDRSRSRSSDHKKRRRSRSRS